MKSILIVSATRPEIAWLEAQSSQSLKGIQIDFLTTGVGMLNAAFRLGAYLSSHQPAMAIQVGIAGAFSNVHPVGSVVEVSQESLPELGAESPQGFLGMKQLGFPVLEAEGKEYFNTLPNESRYLKHLPWVKGISVNRVSGTSETIQAISSAWSPDIETMEGAAFFLAMKRSGIPFMEVRGISNLVEPRNRSAWKIGEAMQASQEEVWAWIKNNQTKMEE